MSVSYQFKTRERGSPDNVYEIAHTKSKPNVLRGFHLQLWDKFVYPAVGNVTVCFYDIREDSVSYGIMEKFEINDKNRCVIYIPSGVAHLYLTHNNTDYFYFHCHEYEEKKTYGFSWRESGLEGKFIISQKDKKALPYKEMRKKIKWL